MQLDIIVIGDFNLDENDEVWESLYEKGFQAALINTKTTLKKNCLSQGYLANAIDNIYYFSSAFKYLESGSLDYIQSCENLGNARLISDHLPVYLEFALKGLVFILTHLKAAI